MTANDTIVAIASPAGRGAVAVIRISGPEAARLAATLLGRQPCTRQAALAQFRDAAGEVLDQGLLLYFPAPASFTGEHVLELQCHGGVVVQDLLLARLLELGCRPARPGEFTERAFLNGKLDIAQAEAVADLIGAGTAAAARAAVRSLQGAFSARIDELQGALTELRLNVEAAIDFPDEDLDLPSNLVLRDRLTGLLAAFDSVSQAAHQGVLLGEGLTVVIAGKPNAGKSSLMNRLAGEEVAIVTDLPGTTRDLLRQSLHLDGLPLHLVDTAGLRPAADAAEAEGIRRAAEAMRRADRLLYVVDAAEAPAHAATPRELDDLPPEIPRTLVYNKIDLTGQGASSAAAGSPPRIYLSARTGAGLDALRAHLKAAAGYGQEGAGVFSARRRHLDALGRARAHVEAAAALCQGAVAPELLAEELRLAQRALGEITGEFTSEDLLGRIFAGFCIGK